MESPKYKQIKKSEKCMRIKVKIIQTIKCQNIEILEFFLKNVHKKLQSSRKFALDLKKKGNDRKKSYFLFRTSYFEHSLI